MIDSLDSFSTLPKGAAVPVPNEQGRTSEVKQLNDRVRPTKRNSILLGGICFILVGGILVFVYQFQSSLLEEIHQERISRQNSEARNSKIVEKLIDKNAEANAANIQALNTFNEVSKEQEETLQKLNLKIEDLEKANELVKKTMLRRGGRK